MLANQTNARHSTGPRTEEGKARVSRNALTHGLTSKKFVLASEHQAEYDQLRAGIFDSWRPASDQERQLTELLAQAQWRLLRLRCTETAFLDQCINEILEENPELDPDQAMALVFSSPVHSKRLSLFLRYQSAIERAYNKAFADLEKAQKMRRQREREQALVESWRAASGFVSQSAENPTDEEPTLRGAETPLCGAGNRTGDRPIRSSAAVDASRSASEN
jgi:hypothetical protein